MSPKPNRLAFAEKVRELSFYAVLFTLPISNALLGISVAVFLLSWVITKGLSREWPRVPKEFMIAGWIFFFMNLLSVILSPHPELGLKPLFSKTGAGLLLFWAIADGAVDRRVLMTGIKVFIASAVLISLDGFWQYWAGKDFLRGHSPGLLDVRHRDAKMFDYVVYSVRAFQAKRVTASLSASNTLGAYLLIPIFMTSGLYFFRGQWKRSEVLKGLVIMTLLLGCLLLTFSRGALLGLFAGLIWLAFWRSRKVLILFFIGLACLWVFARPAYFSRDDGVAKMDPTFQYRTAIWSGALAMARERPWTGHGLNTFHYTFPRYKPQGMVETPYAHNSYLQMLAETGIFGLASFFLLLAAVFWAGLSRNKRWRDPRLRSLWEAASAALVATLCHAAVDNVFFAMVSSVGFWILMGYNLALTRCPETPEGDAS